MTTPYTFTCGLGVDPVAVLTADLEATRESLRQAVASIDRLTAEKASFPRFVFSPSDIKDLPGVTTSPPDYPVEQYKTTIACLKDDVVKYQRQLSAREESTREKDTLIAGLRTARNALYDENGELRSTNKALCEEIVALKARTLAAPNDQEDMAILGRFFKRLVARGRVLVSREKAEYSSLSWARVEPDRHWSCNHYPSDSRLGQILLGLTK